MVSRNSKSGNGKRTSPRKRTGGRWKSAFIAALSRTGVVERSCKAAKKWRTTVYDARRDDEEFRKAWDQALIDSAPYLEEVARQFAIVVRRKYKFHEGQHIMTRCAVDDPECWEVTEVDGKKVGFKPYYEEVISEQLLVKLLEANNHEKFKRRVEVKQTDSETPQGGANIIERLRTASRN